MILGMIILNQYIYIYIYMYIKKLMLYGYRQFQSLPKTEDICSDIAEDVEKRPDTSNYELERPSPKRKDRNVICLMKYELGAKIIKELLGLRPLIFI